VGWRAVHPVNSTNSSTPVPPRMCTTRINPTPAA
jgi:hypothetical protein